MYLRALRGYYIGFYSQQVQRGAVFAFHLPERAIPWCLLRPPPQELGSMPEAPSREMIELHFDHELGLYGFPLRGAFGAPAARSSRRLAGKTWRLDHALQFLRQP